MVANELKKIAIVLGIFIALVAVYAALGNSTGGMLRFAVVLWLISPFFGWYVGSMKQAQDGGLVLGLLLGPIGVVAAGLLDNRPLCPRCGGRVNGTIEAPFPVCQHCRFEYNASTSFPRQAASVRKHELGESDPDAAWERTLSDATKQLVAAGLAPSNVEV